MLIDQSAILDDLLAYDGEYDPQGRPGKRRLTGWEMDFIEELDHKRAKYPTWEPTATQMKKLMQIWDEVFA